MKVEHVDIEGLLETLQREHFLDVPLVRKLDTLLPGEHRSVRLGRGQEFYDIRSYRRFQDPFSSIDIALSRRLRKLVSRLYLQEKELEVFLLVDASEQMCWGGREGNKLSLLLKSVALIGYAVLHSANALGSVCIGFPESSRRPRHNRSELLHLLHSIVEIAGLTTSVAAWERFPYIVQAIRKPALLIIFSDFFFDEGLLGAALREAAVHEILPVVVHSPHEHELPIFLGESYSDMALDEEWSTNPTNPLTQAHFRELVKQYEQQLEELFVRNGVTQLVHVSNPETVFEDIFFNHRINT